MGTEVEDGAGPLDRRRRTFDEVAEQYDRFRPGYPGALIEDVIRLSAIRPRGRILEIGSGTGKATAPFAARGYRMTCLEPGPNLARVAERNLARFPDVAIERCTFEEWQPAGDGFDLVLAAQSFHFVDAQRGLAKAAEALRPSGAIAIFSNHPQIGDSPVHRRVQEAYAQHAPALRSWRDDAGLEDRIDRTGQFGTVIMTRYLWQAIYTADEYVGLMGTQSDHNLLGPERRATLLAAIHSAIAECGGSVTVDYVSHLHLAPRRAGD